MYFAFDDYRPDITPVGSAISWREGVLLSIIFHLVMVVVILVAPKWFPFDAEAARQRALLQQQREQPPNERFVFVQPRVDPRALRPPDRGPLSDQDRAATAPQRAPEPKNEMPMSRGNSFNPVEEDERQAARGRGPSPTPAPPEEAKAQAQEAAPEQPKIPESQSTLQVPNRRAPEGTIARANPGGGALGEALRNLDKYVRQEQFDNPQGGGGSPAPNIQFDTKGVEFGPWLRRFVAQVRRNWEPLIPYAAMSLKGHVVVTFNIHKDGGITDLSVVAPCPVEGFNNAAYGAMAASNPTYPLPPEYPDDKAFFTVTFFYNETPPR